MKVYFVILLLFLCHVTLSQVPVNSTRNDVVISVLPTPKTPQALEISNIGSYNPNLSNIRQNNDRIMADVETYLNKSTDRQKRVPGILKDAQSEYLPSVNYYLPISNKPGKELFYQAFLELAAMLLDSVPVDLTRATYLVEHAYDPSISFEFFNDNIKSATNHVLLKLSQEGYDRSDNLAMNMMIFRFMTDTLEVKYPGIEKPVLTYPKTYDFEDFWGRMDYSKMFVSKLIDEGTGQCHSLPLLYLLIAEQIGAEASLAFAPNHSYIKFKDPYGVWQTLELTVGAVSSDNFIIQSGFVKSEAIKSKIYLDPISEKQVVAQSINDLVMAYTRKYGHDNNAFIQDAIGLVYQEYPSSITAHQILANYFQDRLDYVVQQYQAYGLSKEQFDNDPHAQELLNSVIGANKHIERLGYSPMPEEAYTKWLESVESQSLGQYNKVKMEQLNRLIQK